MKKVWDDIGNRHRLEDLHLTATEHFVIRMRPTSTRYANSLHCREYRNCFCFADRPSEMTKKVPINKQYKRMKTYFTFQYIIITCNFGLPRIQRNHELILENFIIEMTQVFLGQFGTGLNISAIFNKFALCDISPVQWTVKIRV